jgi:hypothetical protein
MALTYVQTLSEVFPAVQFSSLGEAYEDITWIAGDTMPTQAELDAARLTLTRDKMWLAIQEERTKRQAGGVYISSINKWFHSDQSSRIQQLGLVMMGANMPQNINWKTMDGSYVIMTPSIALSIFNGAATLDMTAFGVAEQHRANMMASPTPDTYNFSGFWPAIYGE